jgi:hypothetical protein
MDLFYIIVVSVAVGLLIIILTYIGIHIQTGSTSNREFPPIKQTCPDKWEATMNESDKNILCVLPAFNENSMKNVGNLYNAEGGVSEETIAATPGYKRAASLAGDTVIDFNNAGWSSFGLVSDCKKREWANTYNIVWDGISNYNKC